MLSFPFIYLPQAFNKTVARVNICTETNSYEVNTENQLILNIGDTVFLNIEPENNPISLDEIAIEDNANQNISVDKLIGKKCGDIISGFNYYGGLVNIQIANIKRNVR